MKNRILQLALWQEAERYSNITLLCPNSLSNMKYLDNKWQVTLADGQEITTQLVVGADGANSQVRQMAGIGSNGWQYRQSCMLITVKTQLPPEKRYMATLFTLQGHGLICLCLIIGLA